MTGSEPFGVGESGFEHSFASGGTASDVALLPPDAVCVWWSVHEGSPRD